MKTRLFTALAAAFALMTAPALGQSAPRTLSMTGQGEVKSAPDTVTLSAGVTAQAPTAAAALAQNNARMMAVLAAVHRQGVVDDDIQTADFSVSPQYANDNNNGPARLTGYQVANQVSIRLTDTSKLGAMLDALVTAGANQMNGIDFSIRDSAALLSQARGQAVADALAKAQTYAKAAGVTLGPIQTISESDVQSPRPVFMAAPMVRAAKVPVAMGEESITATVSIVWAIQ
jgi:uncharacterized protein YggE